MSDPHEGKTERRCTKENPCDLAKVDLEKEHWIHEDAYDLFPDSDFVIAIYKCPNCGIEIEVDFS